MKKLLLILITFLLCLCVACSDDNTTTDSLATPDFTQLYIIGEEVISGTGYAGYWNAQKNWIGYTAFEGGASSGIMLSNTLHIIGTIDKGSGGIPCYWKAGARTELETTANPYTLTLDIISKGSDIYIAGIFDTGSGYNACYWKNGTRTDLDVGTSSMGYGIAVIENGATTNVYVAGRYFDTAWKAGYWKNGTRTELTGASRAYSIYRSGNLLYIAGGDGYWTLNTQDDSVTRTTLPSCSGAFRVFKHNGDIYVSGVYNTGKDTACYWKNGVQVTLETNKHSEARDILVSDNTVYAIGRCSPTTNVTADQACIWKNGTRTFLSTKEYSRALRIIGVK